MVQSCAAQPKRMTSYPNTSPLCGKSAPALSHPAFGVLFKRTKSTSFLHHPHPLCLRGLAMHTAQLCHNRTAFCSHGHYKVSLPWDSSANSWDRKVNPAFQILICKRKPCQKKTKQKQKRDKGLKTTNIRPVLPSFLLEKNINQNWFCSRPCG